MPDVPIITAHEFAKWFPPMADDDYEKLKTDIEKNGFDKRFPIIVYQGKILDGINRHRACQETGVLYSIREFKGDEREAIDLVIRANLQRRHLPDDHKVTIYEKAMERRKGWNAGQNNSILEKKKVKKSLSSNTEQETEQESIEQTAQKLGVKPQKIKDYRYIRNNGVPKLLELAENHDVTIEVGNYIAHLSCLEQDEVVELPPSEIIQWVKKHRAKVREDKRRAEEREKENQYYEMQKKIHDSAKEAQEPQQQDNEPPDLNDIAANPDYIAALTKLRKVQYEKDHDTIVTMLTDVVDSLNIVLNFLEDIEQ